MGFDEIQHSLLDELTTYGASELVAYAQPNFLYQSSKTPNDFVAANQPNLTQISAPLAWDFSTGSDGDVVAVGDTGANINHPDFVTNRSPGWHNFVSNNSDVTDDSGDKHGSNVASIIGAQGNNSRYMTGVDWDVSLLILKVLGPNGGSSATIAMGIDQAYNPQNHRPALAINLSLGSVFPSSSIDSTLEGAIGRARNSNMVVVAAAGNNGIDEEQPGNLISPADVAFDNVIAVGSVNSTDAKSSFSNWGRYRVELAAPGENIEGLTQDPNSSPPFTHISGTSQAAPHVTGALELVKNLYPFENYFGIRDRVLMATDDVPSLASFFRTGGRLNLRRALLHRTLIHNLSTRGRVESGDRIMIGGFIIGGSGSLKVAIRGIGPALPALQVPRLSNPKLQLNNSAGKVLFSNDDWHNLPPGQKTDLQAAGLAPTDNREAAMVLTLTPGSYTAFLQSQDGQFGVGLLEIYELSNSTSEQVRLQNVSTRCLVQTGDNVATAGTIITANTADQNSGLTSPKRRLLMRGLGPTLASFGVPGTLPDPFIELHSGTSVLASNNQWADVDDGSTGLEEQIKKNGFAPRSPAESILWPTLRPGSYSTIMSGVGGGIGIGLIEFYER